MKTTQAVILAAGLGTRLQPLTQKIPKPLISINEKPLLSYHIDSLREYGIEQIFVKTFYKNECFEKFVCQPGYDDISLIVEAPKTLGTAGFLWSHSHLFKDELIIVYGDNLTNLDYGRFLSHFSHDPCDFGMAVFFVENLADKGRVEFDGEGRVQRLTEKPKGDIPNAGFANAGIYCFRKKLLKELQFDGGECDFARDVIPALINQGKLVKIYKMKETLIDIGTPEGLSQAKKFAKQITNKLVK
jgi:mannose-1-phosphate guanylyltransferase